MSSHPFHERLTGERRIGASIQLLASLVALMLNFGALIWFAATVTAHLDELTRTVGPLIPQTSANTIAIAILRAEHDEDKAHK